MAVISFSLFLHILYFISFLEKANENVNDNKKKKEENNQNKAFSHSQELLSQLLNAFVAVVVVVAFACFDETTICYVVYHFLTKDLKNRFKSKQKIQKQSRVIVRLVTAIVSKCNFFGEVFWKTILPNS